MTKENPGNMNTTGTSHSHRGSRTRDRDEDYIMELLAQAHTNACGPPGGHSLRLQVGAVQFSLVVGEVSPAPAAVPAWLGEHSFREASSQRVPVS